MKITARLVLLMILAAPLVGAVPLRAEPIRAGFAERDITPEIGMERPGGYHKVFHRRLHDPCKVRAAVFDDGRRQVAVVGVDALVVPRQLVLACREVINKRWGIKPQAVMIAASHSHSSGPTGMVQPGQYDDADAFVQKLAYEDSSCANPEYLQRVQQAIIDAVGSAFERRQPVRCGFGSGREDQVAFNRRFRMRNGLTMTHPRQGNPDIVEVAGPTDPEVGVIGAWDEKNQLVGCIVNFACHATTSPGGISANYIWFLEKVIRGAMGQDVVVVFTAGASGDVTQVDNLSPYQQRPAEESAMYVGGRVGAEAVKVLLSVAKGTEVPVDCRSKVLRIRRRVPRPEHVAQALKLLKDPPSGADRTQLTFAKETVMLAALLKKEPVAEVEVQAIQIGPAVLVGNPAEYFCQYGLQIKKDSPFPLTLPVSLANGFVGYVPTEEAFGPHGGGYETRLTSYSNLIPTAGTTIANESVALTRQLQPGPVPQRPPHPPFTGKGWSYGDTPPQVD